MSLLLIVLIVGSDFPINVEFGSQQYPVVLFANNQYYVFWADMRFYPDLSIYSARVTTAGMVLDPTGKLVIRDKAVKCDLSYDGSNFLVVLQDSC
jgi:hypothetical protein